MWKAVARGFVRHEDAVFVNNGLRDGFTAGVDVNQLGGHRWFKNYQSALEGREPVTRAIMKRVQAGKTLDLGLWTNALADGLKSMFSATAIFPMGAAKKALEASELRPTDDHTRTGLNAATSLEGLRHSLDAYSEISWFMQLDHFMRVSDVEGAFTLLPLHPSVWPYFMFRFFADQAADAALHLFMHVCGDFGAAGMPGTFKIFFVDVIVQMARSEQVLSLPMAVYVDDCALMGGCREEVDAEMLAFHDFCAEVCGVLFKALKDRVAAPVQLALGFWWDSSTLTRELEGGKLTSYMELLAEYATRDTLTLREMQSVAGRMQRCIMTFPPGAAWMLVPLFALMSRLKLPHHRRRTTREVRSNFKYCSAMLERAMGRGFYSYANHKRAPPVWTDASKSGKYAGGGFLSACGRYDFWKYGSRAGRKLIDVLEGDTVVVACHRLARYWWGCIVTIFCDNKAFQQSGAKGRSKAARLNDLVKELFLLMVKYNFVVDLQWISTDDNVNADDLSRDKEQDFLDRMAEEGATVARMEGAGRTRQLPEKRGSLEEMTVDTPDDDGAITYAARAMAAHPGRVRRAPILLVLAIFGCFCVPTYEAMPQSRFDASLSYSQTSIFDGLPRDLYSSVEQVLDNRISSSSWRKVRAGVNLWRAVADGREWSHIISSGDPERGGKLVAFVMHLLTDTELVYSSIETYVWGVRTWMKHQHQQDPVMGVRGWTEFMKGIKVLAWVPSEPRKRVPVEVVSAILSAIDFDSFWEVQLGFILLVLLFTFSRTECPCPKSFEGRECYDEDVHWNVEDFKVEHVAGVRALLVRFRVIKQDQRVERPEARGDGDWAVVGDVPDSKFSPIKWYTELMKKHGGPRPRRDPMFLDPDMTRPLLYRKLNAQFQALQRRVGVAEEELAGCHGLRVEGYNNTKNKLGEDLSVAHGLWKSTAHKRYDRFDLARVVRIPSAIVGLDEGDDSAATNEVEERSAGPPARRVRRGDFQRPASPAGGDDDEEEDDEDDDDVGAQSAEEEEEDEVQTRAAGALLSLTPGGSTATPAGYWGTDMGRPAPGTRRQAYLNRVSPSSPHA